MTAHTIHTNDLASLEAAIGVGSELGKSLNYLRHAASALDPESRAYPIIMDSWVRQGASRARAAELLNMLISARTSGSNDDYRSFIKELGKSLDPSFLKKYLEFYKGSLMGYPSFVANLGSNALFQAVRGVEDVVSSVMDAARAGITGTARTRYLGDSYASMHGMSRAFREWLPTLGGEVKDAFLLKPFKFTGTLADFDLVKFPPQIQGLKGEAARFAYKIMNSTDAFFKHLARYEEWYKQANRYLESNSHLKTGNRARDLDQVVNEIMGEFNRKVKGESTRGFKWLDAIEKGEKAALELTFQSELGTTGKSIQNMLNNNPWAQFFFPFYKTPTNIFKETIKRTPLGLAWALKEYRAAKKSGNYDPGQMLDNFAKPIVGTTVMTAVGLLAMNEVFSGKGPQDPEQQEAKKATGWQPYSINFSKLMPGIGPNQWVSYQRLEPISSLLGMAADFVDIVKSGDAKTAGKLASAAMASADQNFLNKTFWTTLEGLVSAASDPARYGPRFIKNLQAQFIPNTIGPVPFGHLARVIDPYYRKTEAFGASPFIAKIPGLSATLEPQRTPLGQERERAGGTGFERLVSPFARSAAKTGPEADAGAEMARIHWAPSQVKDSVKLLGKDVFFTRNQKETLAQAQQQATEEFSKLIKTKYYKSLPDTEEEAELGQSTKQEAARKLFRDANRVAMATFRADLYARLRRKEYTPGKAVPSGPGA